MKENDVLYRVANIDDVDFIIDQIIESEKSGSNTLSYSKIFGLSELEVRKYLKLMLMEDMEGCAEFSVRNYLLAEKDDKVIAGVCAWIEAENGISSSVSKGNLLNYYFPSEAIQKAIKLQSILSDLHFNYNHLAIHMRTTYVTKNNRGKGLGFTLKEKIIESLTKDKPNIKEVYIDTFSCNKASLRTNEKLGFTVVDIKESSSEEILNYLPSNKKVMQKKVL